MSKLRHFDVITSKWRRFDVITTSLLRNVSAEMRHPVIWLGGRLSIYCQIDSYASINKHNRRGHCGNSLGYKMTKVHCIMHGLTSSISLEPWQITGLIKRARPITPISIRTWGWYSWALQWRHNGRDSVSNHQPREYSLSRLNMRWSKKTSKLRVTGLCAGNSPETGEFPAQRASNAENVFIWWRHHGHVDQYSALSISRGHLSPKNW